MNQLSKAKRLLVALVMGVGRSVLLLAIFAVALPFALTAVVIEAVHTQWTKI